ncbi:MAG: DnaJ domain-containing protein [Hyphomicrobiaceae bacterium]
MKLNSKYFDSIRIKSRQQETPREERPQCQWKGCGRPASHRAPARNGREGEYVRLCIEHVREFNASYDYFKGMSEAEVEAFQRAASTGHRPTWRLGERGIADKTGAPAGGGRYARFAPRADGDPHRLFGQDAAAAQPEKEASRRFLRPLERKALETLFLPETASKSDIKSRFKELVKRHHPDSNGGDRASEEKLREIIQAYNYLKQAGLV